MSSKLEDEKNTKVALNKLVESTLQAKDPLREVNSRQEALQSSTEQFSATHCITMGSEVEKENVVAKIPDSEILNKQQNMTSNATEEFVEGVHSKTQLIELQIKQALNTATNKLNLLNQDIEEAERENDLLMAEIEQAT